MVGTVFNLVRYSTHDGPGIRTTVFLKGCPLACRWCHNPESQDFRPTVMFFAERCRRCGDCAAACLLGTAARGADCLRCGACAEACAAGARQMVGREMSVAEVVAEVERDTVFFDESGGGVTVSGGEPLAQPAFTEELLRACRERRIHTALDTCGFARQEVALRVAQYADLVLYDLKALNAATHEACTGVSNGIILDNLRALAAAGRRIVVRVPLVPGVNDSEDQLRELAAFLTPLGLRRIDLLPFHTIGFDKYSRLGMKPPEDAATAAPDTAAVAAKLRGWGFEAGIGG